MVISAFIAANTDYVMLMLFALVMTVLLYFKRKNLELQKILFPFLYLIMYKTKWGLKKMDSIANKLMPIRKQLTYVMVITGFIGMVVAIWLILQSAYLAFFDGQADAVVPLLPGVTIPGIGTLSFVHWIIAIFILATVHELAHGIVARMYKIKVKSSGFAFMGILLPIIPAAFVEPDEKEMEKASKKAKLAVLSAGTFSNFIFAFLFFILSIGFAAAISSGMGPLVEDQGIMFSQIEEGGPANIAGIGEGEIIKKFNGVEITGISTLLNVINKTVPSQKIEIETDVDTYQLTLQERPEKEYGHLGAGLSVKREVSQSAIDKYGSFTIETIQWINMLLLLLFLTNLMVGIINLLPVGIVDGGQMFFVGLSGIIKNKKVAKIIFSIVSIVLLVILLGMVLPAMGRYFISPFQ